MAAKGYVVLFTNPRGSSNYGQDFGNIIQFRYPGDDYKDLMAGVDEVLKKGYVDETRMGVTGGSGGGLLTNWVVTQTNRFKAAVSQRDISDWTTFWYTADFWLFNPTWFRKAPFEDPADFAQRSPITHVEEHPDAADVHPRRRGLAHAAVSRRRAAVPGAEVPEAADGDGALPRREPRALPLGQALAPRRASPAHRRLVRQVLAGQGDDAHGDRGCARGESGGGLASRGHGQAARAPRHHARRHPARRIRPLPRQQRPRCFQPSTSASTPTRNS